MTEGWRWQLFVWFIILVGLGLLGCQSDISDEFENKIAGTDVVMYVVPENQANLAPEASIFYGNQLGLENFTPIDLRPEALQAYNIVPIEATTEWDVVTEKALQGHLQGVIIHHEALALPMLMEDDIETLRIMFRSGIVIGGIGIPGDLLVSEILGVPNLFGDVVKYGYPTPYYYYIFVITVEAKPEEQARLIHALEQGATFEESLTLLPANSQAMSGYSSATDGLFTGNVEQMLRALRTKIRS